MTKDKDPISKARKTAIMFVDTLSITNSICRKALVDPPTWKHDTPSNSESVIQERRYELAGRPTVDPVFTIITGKPFWDYNDTPERKWKDQPWARPDIDAVFCIFAYEEEHLCKPDRFESEVRERALYRHASVGSPLSRMVSPFSMSGVAVEGSSVMLIDPQIYTRFEFRRDITWKGTFIVRCPVESLLRSLCPSMITPIRKERGVTATPGLDALTPPDDLGKAIGMGYLASIGTRDMDADRWRAWAGLVLASRANGIATEGCNAAQIAPGRESTSCEGDEDEDNDDEGEDEET